MDRCEKIIAQLDLGNSWTNRSDGWWLEAPDMDVEKMAHSMTEVNARLVTMTAYQVSNGEFRIIYHWDLEGRMLNMVTITRKGGIPSIVRIHPASDWIEREIHDYFAVQFTGRELPPLFLHPEDSPGIFLDHSENASEKGKGRER